MNCKFINVLAFAVGAALGSAVTWKIVKDKYDRIVQDEIESVKKAFASGVPELPEKDDDHSEDDAEEEPEQKTHRQINWANLEDLDEDEDDEYEPNDADLNEYARLLDQYTSEKGGAEVMTKAPYVIDPNDCGEIDGYHQIELTYYADDVLEDDEYNIVTDIDELLGPKALTTFGEYEDDSVYVRNERLRTDFIVLRDPRTYEQARSIAPTQVDDE